ncbi:hypothetical protein [Pusillimonas sp. ANT_WB101]|uniref:hypothetical protein n=1 Tax=Pusillimonas sp. ANT_WB101 TaxID=2597356 RepID=UPI0011EFFFB7|nr:hypothetical protein [Pusillimonas sp. ANT_WB101]KAA0910408.1 hypothetical protein FQ179_00440 [Pusillimonas sp. ANT_WB101]
MKIRMAVTICLGLFLVGCQSPSQVVSGKEDLLSAAGFVAKSATSPQQQAALKKLPPNKFLQQNQNNQIVYLYADPIVCQCVYSGNQAAYSKYSQMVFQKNLANEQQMTATMDDNAFDFGPWGGMWGFR